MTLGEIMRTDRIEKDLTQHGYGHVTGLSLRTVGDVENDKVKDKATGTIRKILAAAGYEIDTFYVLASKDGADPVLVDLQQ
jgi:transcriptional regulator with XRE-family HTH domain